MQSCNRALQCPSLRPPQGSGDPEVRRGGRGKIARQAGFPRFVPVLYIRDVILLSTCLLGVGQDFRKPLADDLINRL